MHEFPDGTADAVIDKAMKDYAVQSQSRPGFIERVGDTIVRNLKDPVGEWKKRAHESAEQFQKEQQELTIEDGRPHYRPKESITESIGGQAAMGFAAPSGGNTLAAFGGVAPAASKA